MGGSFWDRQGRAGRGRAGHELGRALRVRVAQMKPQTRQGAASLLQVPMSARHM